MEESRVTVGSEEEREKEEEAEYEEVKEDDEEEKEVEKPEEEERVELSGSSMLTKLLSQMGLVAPGGAMAGDEKPTKLLSEFTLNGIAEVIRRIHESSDDKKKIVVMTGAGISTDAGIPDFRTPGTGLYDNLQKYNLPNPQAIFTLDYFRHNPKPFCMLAKELFPTNFKPTVCHYFIRLLAEKGILLRNFTQNIDCLERRAGMDPDLLVEAHGGFSDAHCIDCGHEYPEEFVKEHVFKDRVPKCTQESCKEHSTPSSTTGIQEVGDNVVEDVKNEPVKGLVKPDIVFFGEALPERFAKCAVEDMAKCELLIVMGTSLRVQPFASLVDRVRSDCPRLLINRERVGEGDPMMRMLGFNSGMDFSEESGYRDVFQEGTCDDGCKELAEILGWKEELEEMVSRERAKLNTQQT